MDDHTHSWKQGIYLNFPLTSQGCDKVITEIVCSEKGKLRTGSPLSFNVELETKIMAKQLALSDEDKMNSVNYDNRHLRFAPI